MSGDGEQRGSYGSAAFGVIVVSLMAYLAFAAVQGEYGLLRLVDIEAQETELRDRLAQLEVEREALANKTRRLSSGHLDLELLDERARAVLGVARPDEIMIR